MIDAIQSKLEKKFADDPSLIERWTPASNFDELKLLHDKYAADDVEFEETTETQEQQETTQEEMGTNNDFNFEDEEDSSNAFIDPLNREAKKVRDYVGDTNFTEHEESSGPVRSTFEEPVDFHSAFDIPDDNEPSNDQKAQQGKDSSNDRSREEKPKREPFNPSFDDMSSGKKKRSTKKFAKYIVETVCMLSEKGFVYFANKDISEAKLAEYEISGELDLGLFLTLEDGQEITVKQFFKMQSQNAEQLLKIDQEEKDDLAEALAEVMLEKGVGPTPTQELMLIALKIFGGQAVTMMTLRAQTNGVLAQLRAMNEGGYDSQYQTPAPQPSAPAPQQEQYPEHSEPQPQPMYVADETDVEMPAGMDAMQDDFPIIEGIVETKE